MKKTKSRGLVTIGFLILIFAAFLPQLKSCSGDNIVPIVTAANSKTFDISILIFFFPFIFAFIGFISYLTLLFYSKLEKSKSFTIFICIFCIIFLAFPGLAFLLPSSIQFNLQILYLILFLASLIVTMSVRWENKRPVCVSIFSFVCFSYFIPIVLFSFEQIAFGIWFSISGSIAVCWGSAWEITIMNKKDP